MPGVDVLNTFAPVVKGITVRLLLALSLVFQMHVNPVHSEIEGDVYMQACMQLQIISS